MNRYFLTWLISVLLLSGSLFAQNTKDSTAADSGKVMITIILRPNQDMSVTEIQQQMLENGFWKDFPPENAEVISWYSVMGVGYIITVKIHASKLSELNEAVQNAAWGAFSTEFYPAYDYMPVYKDMKGKYR
jgi:hypothetical protein